MQFTLRQLFWWVFVSSVFFASWKTTESVIFAAVLAVSLPTTAALKKRDSREWRSRHRNSMLEDLWLMVTVFYLLVVLGFLTALLLPAVR